MLDSVTSFINQPFSTEMNLWHWALFILVILVIIYLWNDVLKLIVE